MHIDHRIPLYDLVATQWTARARRAGRRSDPRSRTVRASTTRLTLLLAELRKRLASAQDLALEIEALIIEAGAEDAVEDAAQAAQQQEAA